MYFLESRKVSSNSYYLLLIETSGNQASVFATNKLRENIGASELIRRIGMEFVLEAVSRITEKELNYTSPRNETTDNQFLSVKNVKDFILSDQENAKIENSIDNKIEILLATSGKAMLLTRKREVAEEIVEDVTWRAHQEAPGIAVLGAIVEVENLFQKELLIHKQIKKVHERIGELNSTLFSPKMRFSRLPFIDECHSSGHPAQRMHSLKDGDIKADDKTLLQVSAVSFAKREAAKHAWDRLKTSFYNFEEDKEDVLKNPKWLEDRDYDRYGIVHADGNGLGEIFLKFSEYADATSDRGFIEKYKRFCLELDECTFESAKEALNTTWPKLCGRDNNFDVPLVPVIMGGDDLTVICDGRRAVEFTAQYLQTFEIKSGTYESLKEVFKKRFSVGRLSASAGVAIVKAHFPFHRAYDIAEDLIKSAKNVKKIVTHKNKENENVPFPCSTLDYQVIFDSSSSDLKSIRERLEISDESRRTRLYAKPYVVSNLEEEDDITGTGWAAERSYKKLTKRIKKLEKQSSVDENETLSRSQQHELCDGLFLGKEIADARLRQIPHRYNNKELWDNILPDEEKETLFFEEQIIEYKNGKSEEIQIFSTPFLDAMELVDLVLPDNQTENSSSKMETENA